MTEEATKKAEEGKEPALEKEAEEYVPLTPTQKVAKRMEEGAPVDLLLRYMHAQSSVPKGVRVLVDLARELKVGLKVLSPLTHNGDGALRVDPGSSIEGASDLMVEIRRLERTVEEFLPRIKTRIGELIKE